MYALKTINNTVKIAETEHKEGNFADIINEGEYSKTGIILSFYIILVTDRISKIMRKFCIRTDFITT
jgi:hypothetical protein